MSQHELEALEKEEAEMRRKLEEMRQRKMELLRAEAQRKNEERRLELLKKEVVLDIYNADANRIFFKAFPRPDFVDLTKRIQGLTFSGHYDNTSSGEKKYSIPTAGWDEFLRELFKLPNATAVWQEKAEIRYNFFRDAPPWEIDFSHKRDMIVATRGPEGKGGLWGLPGSNHEWDNAIDSYRWYIPTNEAWRIPEKLDGVDGVVYTTRAREIVENQLSRRAALNNIAIQEDTDFDKINLLTREIWNPSRGKKEPFKDALRPHQKVMIEFMYQTNGEMINSDDTGTGKTWEALGFTEILRAENPESFQCIFVGKASNLPSLTREIRNLTGTEPYLCISGKPDAVDAMEISIKKTPYILISHDTLGAYKRIDSDGNEVSKSHSKDGTRIVFPWVTIFNMAKPTILIVDEAHLVKNPQAYRTKAIFALDRPPMCIPMTATPVRNRAEEFGNLIRLVKPHQFNSHSEFVDAYTTNNGKQVSNPSEFHRMMQTFFLRRLKGDVMKGMPEINRMERFHDLSEEAAADVQRVLQGFYRQLAEFDPSSQGGGEVSVMSMLAELNRISMICAADKSREFTPNLAREIVEEANGDAGKKKVGIFSWYKGVAWHIADRLGPEAVCTVKNNGGNFTSLNVHERDRLFESIKDDDSIKYVVMTSGSATGSNLPFLWWMIFNDPWWTPMDHYQAEGRGIRISDPHSVDSYYVIANTQVEELRFEILAEKLAITNEAVEGIENNREFVQSTHMEVINRLRQSAWSRS